MSSALLKGRRQFSSCCMYTADICYLKVYTKLVSTIEICVCIVNVVRAKGLLNMQDWCILVDSNIVLLQLHVDQDMDREAICVALVSTSGPVSL